MSARAISYQGLQSAAELIDAAFVAIGYRTEKQSFEARGKRFHNIIAERPGSERGEQILVVGDHYDTHKNSPGANDNASAIAALIEMAGAAYGGNPRRTLRFVAFPNEETPFTRTRDMGSLAHARLCRDRQEKIIGMLCLEMLGCFSQELGSQWLSFWGISAAPTRRLSRACRQQTLEI